MVPRTDDGYWYHLDEQQCSIIVSWPLAELLAQYWEIPISRMLGCEELGCGPDHQHSYVSLSPDEDAFADLDLVLAAATGSGRRNDG